MPMDEIEQIERVDEERRYRQELCAVQESAMDSIRNNPTMEVFDKYYSHLYTYIEAVAKRRLTSLFIKGQPATGKTYMVMKKLTDLGLKMGKDFVVLKGHSTPLELFNSMYEHRDKLCFIDDLDNLLDDKDTVSLLKSATWSPIGVRTIAWRTTSTKRSAPEEYNFTGSLIVCLNKTPKDENIKALFSRGVYQEVNLTFGQKLELMYGLAQKVNYGLAQQEALSIMDFIKANSNPTTDLDLRTLIKGVALYKMSKEDKKTNWRDAVKRMLITNDTARALYDAIREYRTPKERIKAFMEDTGLSKRSYYLYKAEYGL